MLILAERNLKNIKHIPFHNYDILLKKKKKLQMKYWRIDAILLMDYKFFVWFARKIFQRLKKDLNLKCIRIFKTNNSNFKFSQYVFRLSLTYIISSFYFFLTIILIIFTCNINRHYKSRFIRVNTITICSEEMHKSIYTILVNNFVILKVIQRSN